MIEICAVTCTRRVECCPRVNLKENMAIYQDPNASFHVSVFD